MFWEKKTKIRKHIIFYGRVQGVGFRYYAVQKANQLGLTGWVKNLYDGSVEMEVEGEEPLIDQLIIFLQNRTYVWIENMDAKSIPLEHERILREIKEDIICRWQLCGCMFDDKKLKESKECDRYAMYNNFSRKKSKL